MAVEKHKTFHPCRDGLFVTVRESIGP